MQSIISTTETYKQQYINGLQVLRGLCCILIPVVHSFAYTEWAVADLSFGFFFGRSGMLNLVAIFMMLSAFLTVKKLDSGNFGFFNFIKGRIYGIFPIYWMCVLVNIIITLCTHNAITVADDFWKSLFLIPCDTTYICGVEWTLWYEVTFYLLISVFFISKHGKKLYPFALILYLVAYIFFRNGAPTSNNIFHIPLSNTFLNFWVGSCLYYITKHIDFGRFSLFNKKPFVILGCVAFFPLAVCALDSVHFPADTALKIIIANAICCICIIFFMHLDVGSKNMLVLFGNASYGIYLLHPTILQVMIVVLMHRAGGYSAIFHVLLVVSGIGICFVIATLIKRLSNVFKINSAEILPKWISY